MNLARTALSTVLGVTLFFSTSAISQMGGFQQKSTGEVQNQIPQEETRKDTEPALAELYNTEIDRSTEAEQHHITSTRNDFVIKQRDEYLWEQLEELDEAVEVFIEPEIHEIQKKRVFECSESDKLLIARVVYAESRGEIFEGQVAVATVVFNRYYSGKYGSTIKKIVFAPDQFAIGDKYNQSSLKAVETAITRTGDYPENMYYFRTSKSHVWRNFVYYTRIGGHSFYLGAE